MKHINITNFEGSITDWTKLNYIAGGMEDDVASLANQTGNKLSKDENGDWQIKDSNGDVIWPTPEPPTPTVLNVSWDSAPDTKIYSVNTGTDLYEITDDLSTFTAYTNWPITDGETTLTKTFPKDFGSGGSTSRDPDDIWSDGENMYACASINDVNTCIQLDFTNKTAEVVNPDLFGNNRYHWWDGEKMWMGRKYFDSTTNTYVLPEWTIDSGSVPTSYLIYSDAIRGLTPNGTSIGVHSSKEYLIDYKNYTIKYKSGSVIKEALNVWFDGTHYRYDDGTGVSKILGVNANNQLVILDSVTWTYDEGLNSGTATFFGHNIFKYNGKFYIGNQKVASGYNNYKTILELDVVNNKILAPTSAREGEYFKKSQTASFYDKYGRLGTDCHFYPRLNHE